jgi:hypothetical protein
MDDQIYEFFTAQLLNVAAGCNISLIPHAPRSFEYTMAFSLVSVAKVLANKPISPSN